MGGFAGGVVAALFVPECVEAFWLFHAAAHDCDDGVWCAEEESEEWVGEVFDDDECEDDVYYPACNAVVFPDEPPGFFG